MTQEAQLRAFPKAEAIAQKIADRTRLKKNTDTYARIYQAAYAGAIAARTPDSVIAELVEAAQGLKADFLERAEWDGDVRVVCAGAGAWVRFCNALAKLEGVSHEAI